jgi:protein-disulfide isomerase
VIINRRDFVVTSAALALAGNTLSGLIAPAAAQTPSPADLAKPGPLGDQVQGKDDAPVTVIEYASMTCGHCATFHNETYPVLKSKYIDTGKVRYILREFALNDVDFLAIVIARCAPKERQFPLIETLFEKQDQWAVNNPIPPLQTIAKQAGFTDESFKACAANQKLIEGVKAQRDAGAKFGVTSTPTFFINGEKRAGDMPIEEIEKAIQPYLKAG